MVPQQSVEGIHSTLPRQELLNWVTSRGLGIEYQFVRQLTSSGPMNLIKLFLKNHSSDIITQIRISKVVEGHGMNMAAFASIPKVGVNQEVQTTVSIDFNSKVQPAQFDITDSNGTHSVKIHAEAGELLRPINMPLEEYTAVEAKLQGMHMSTGQINPNGKNVSATVQGFANVVQIDDVEGEYKFAGTTLSGDKPVLISMSAVADSQYLKYRLHVENAVLAASLQAGLNKAFME